MAATIAIVLLAGEAAWADCTPAAANGVTSHCTGATIGSTAGYGTGVETGVTVTVEGGATVTGLYGIWLGEATVTNKVNASIAGGGFGIVADSGALPMSSIPAASSAIKARAFKPRPTSR